MKKIEHIQYYSRLIRLDKPIGVLLLLWPTLWAVWLASAGQPSMKILAIFVSGVFLMRSAGCVMNDIADRNFDGFVERTRERPLATGKVKTLEALLLAASLAALAFCLVLFCNPFAIKLSFIGAALALVYPFLKRVTYLPQIGLGVAFAWGVPMAFAATLNQLPPKMWWLFAAAMLWPVIYDTMYAMADRKDDIEIGVKSTAILFGEMDVAVLLAMQSVFLGLLMHVGSQFNLHAIYFISLILVSLLFSYQYALIKNREPEKCFQAFLNNNWVGFIIFSGIALSFIL